MDDVRTIPTDVLAKLFHCGICQGLVVEAVSLPECSHIFCKSCIIIHCWKVPALCPYPDCRANIHASKPQNCLKNDTDLQTLINKLFPEVYLNEMQHRRAFFDDYISQRDASIHQYTGEQIGVPQNRDYFRQIPKLMQLTLQYDAELEYNEMCFRPSRLCKKVHAVVMPSNTMMKYIRKFVCLKHHVDSTDQAVLLHSNSLVKDDYQLSYFLRFGMVEGDTVHLKYCFANFPEDYDDLTREASIRKMVHRRPLNVIPLKEEPALAPVTPPIPSEPEPALQVRLEPATVTPPTVAPASIPPPVIETVNDLTQPVSPPQCPSVIVSRLSKPVKKKRHVADIMANDAIIQDNEQREREKAANRILDALFLTEHPSTEPEPLFSTSVISVSSPPKRPRFPDECPNAYDFEDGPYQEPLTNIKPTLAVPPRSQEIEAYLASVFADHNYSKAPEEEPQGFSHSRVVIKPARVTYIDLTLD